MTGWIPRKARITGPKQTRRRNSARPSRWKLGIESLEGREMLAGDIIAAMDGLTLRVHGDDLDNAVVISQDAGRLTVVAADDSTTVRIEGELGRAATMSSISLDLGFGSDHVEIRDLNLKRDVVVDSVGDGGAIESDGVAVDHDQVLLVGVQARGVTVEAANTQVSMEIRDSGLRKMTARANGGEFSMSLSSTSVAGNISLTTLNGGRADVQVVGDSLVKGLLSVRSSGESHLVIGDQATVSRAQQITVGGGESETLVRDSANVRGNLQAVNREGGSKVQIIDDAQVGRFIGSGHSTLRNVTYVTRDSGALKADVYTPRSLTTSGEYPAVILVHGGGWRTGSKTSMSAVARDLAERGYVAISINYRLAPANPYPAQIDDVRSAIGWAVDNAAAYQIDVTKIGLYGYSAGAHLALLAGMKNASPVTAVVAGGPGVDFRNVVEDDRQYAHLFGGTREELPEAYADASPAHWISADDPALFLFVGERDTLIQRDNLDAFYAATGAAGLDSELYTAPRKSHLGARVDPVSRLRALRFLDERMK